MVKALSLILCSLTLFGNELVSAIDSKSCSEKNSVNDYESVSEIYEVKTIGVSPNESHINGYTQGLSKVAQNVSYSNANMVNYNLNSGVTTFENFDPDSYSMKGQSETISLTTETETTKISNLNISECDSILTSKAYVPDDAEVDCDHHSRVVERKERFRLDREIIKHFGRF